MGPTPKHCRSHLLPPPPASQSPRRRPQAAARPPRPPLLLRTARSSRPGTVLQVAELPHVALCHQPVPHTFADVGVDLAAAGRCSLPWRARCGITAYGACSELAFAPPRSSWRTPPPPTPRYPSVARTCGHGQAVFFSWFIEFRLQSFVQIPIAYYGFEQRWSTRSGADCKPGARMGDSFEYYWEMQRLI
jgi:hypothetical protein